MYILYVWIPHEDILQYILILMEFDVWQKILFWEDSQLFFYLLILIWINVTNEKKIYKDIEIEREFVHVGILPKKFRIFIFHW